MTFNQFGNSGSYVNGSSYNQSRERDAGEESVRDSDFDVVRTLTDEPMERIRELLFGDMRRSWEARLQTLETRLETLELKLDALRHETRTEQQGQLSTLAEGIDQLGEHIRRLTRS